MASGLIFDIQHFCTHDGPGIRTVVFLKGCMMTCPWCHNPEGRSSKPDLLFADTLCIGCRECAKVCPTKAHSFGGNTHILDRKVCKSCMACADACPTGALEVAGRLISVEDVMAEVLKDWVFYEQSGGGVTLSGGEPLYQADFACDLLKACNVENLHTCVETSGNAPRKAYERIIPYTNLFLWDIKDTDSIRHRAKTGVELSTVVNNLRMIDDAGCSSILRCIILKGINLNDEHIAGIAAVYHSLKHCLGVELLPYHPLGESKMHNLGRETVDSASGWICSAEDIQNAGEKLADVYGVRVCGLPKS